MKSVAHPVHKNADHQHAHQYVEQPCEVQQHWDFASNGQREQENTVFDDQIAHQMAEDVFVDDDKADYYRNLEKPEKPENNAPAKIVEQFQIWGSTVADSTNLSDPH